MISFGALFVVTGKRLAEFHYLGGAAGAHREVLDTYTRRFLESTLTLCAGVTVTGYCLWAFWVDASGLGVHHDALWIQLSVGPRRPRGPLRPPPARRGPGRRARGPRAARPHGPGPRRLLGRARGDRGLHVSTLRGWGRTQPAVAQVVTPANEDDVAAILAGASRGAIARGLGRAYGDAAQVAGGVVIDNRGLGGVGPIDASTGEVTLGAGTSLDDLLRVAVPQGWFVPVSPGRAR